MAIWTDIVFYGNKWSPWVGKSNLNGTQEKKPLESWTKCRTPHGIVVHPEMIILSLAILSICPGAFHRMKNKIRNSFAILFICFQVILFTGCGTILYTSTNPPVNLTEKSGQIYANAAAGTNGFNATAGFSPGEHFQVAAAYSNNTIDEENENTKRVSQEFMVGYFNKFESDFVLETFLGVGTGSTKTTVLALPLFSDIKDTTRHTGECNKLFLQLNYGIKSSWREVGLSIRCSQLNYSNVEKTGSGGFVQYKGSPKAVLWEPVAFTKIGNENFKLTLMVGMPYIPGVMEISYEKFFISAGVGVNFSL